MSGKERKRSADLSNFIDEHLQELKWTSCGLGAFAVLILIRKLNMAKKFVDINQIPTQYIAESYILQGHVRHINDKGVLKIDHTPILEMKWIPSIFSFLRRDASKINGEYQYLSVLPAGLDMNPDAVH